MSLDCEEYDAHDRSSHGPTSRAALGTKSAMVAGVACGAGYAAMAGLARLGWQGKEARGGAGDRWLGAD